MRRALSFLALFFVSGIELRADEAVFATAVQPFLKQQCHDCHNDANKSGNLDLTTLSTDVSNPLIAAKWVRIHDRVRDGEMPPAKQPRPPEPEMKGMLQAVSAELTAAEQKRNAVSGRAPLRRLNRVEYENTLRDLLAVPGLNVRDLLPDDGRAFGYDKSAAALDISAVQMAKYLEAADVALTQAIAQTGTPPQSYKSRVYLSECYDFLILLTNGDSVFLKDNKFDARFPILKDKNLDLGQALKDGLLRSPATVGVFRNTDESFPGRIDSFVARHPGRYQVRLSVWSYQWEKGEVKASPRTEAADVRVNGRLIGHFDAPSLEPRYHEVETWMERGEFLTVNPAASLWPVHIYHRQGKTSEFTGPGVAVDWVEIEGPLYDLWPPQSHRKLFGDLPLVLLDEVEPSRRPKRSAPPSPMAPPYGNNPVGRMPWATSSPAEPGVQAERLLKSFLPQAFRRPVAADEVAAYVELAKSRLQAGDGFEQAMRTAYQAVLCSPDFLYLRTVAGPLDDYALASRLSYFLWNSMPDAVLFELAAKGQLKDPAVLRAQVDRMLGDPKSDRFVADFLDQWLELRDIDATTPDRNLYPEFSPYLRASMQQEPRAFVRELVKQNRPATSIVQSDFAPLNQVLAELYGVPNVTGSQLRNVALPAETHRGGLLTEAAVLKVTANGTTTSPVRRGAWVQRKIVGKPPEPPPPNIPAIEPDVRGATTVRELLVKHRDNVACAACHAKMDPPGFALESFDVIGGFRDRYRSLGTGDPADPLKKIPTYVHIGYRLGPKVDAAGETLTGKPFTGIDDFRKLLLEDPRQIARNLANQLLTYSTGAPVSFADRAAIEQTLDRVAGSNYGIRSLIQELVQSPVFLSK